MATNWKYLPILKWKQGERIALRNLDASQWRDLVPLIEFLPIEASPTSAALNAAMPAYVEKIAKELSKSMIDDWPVAIDTRYVSPAFPHQARLLAITCNRLAKATKLRLLPVITQAMLAEAPIELNRLAAYEELLVRIVTPFTQAEAVGEIVKFIVGAGIPKRRLHVIIDQFSLVGESPAAKWTTMRPYLDAALAAGTASTTLAGGSFPLNLIGIAQGIKDLPRVEWQIWKSLRRNSDYSAVRYSDYTVSNPALGPELDPDKINPSVAIRYAAPDHWRVFKAGGFKKGKPNQLKNLCKLLVSDTVYSGVTFSFGDANYDKASKDPSATAKNGNPSSWRRDATNHHLVLTGSAL